MASKWTAYKIINGSQRTVYAEVENDNWYEAREVLSSIYGDDVYNIQRVRGAGGSSGGSSSGGGDVSIWSYVVAILVVIIWMAAASNK